MPLPQDIPSSSASPLSQQSALAAFVGDAAFPCVGAKSALNTGRMRFAEYSSLGNPADAADLCRQLRIFSDEFPNPGTSPASFVAMFREQVPDEEFFEAALWQHLQLLHDHDRLNFKWDSSVDSDPGSKHFSFSIGGRAFFVVGLHKTAARVSRRAPFPCLVFNFHNQFKVFKSSGKYQGLEAVIRARDLALQGSLNPVLARFGGASEARQYSGRSVEADWQCPFKVKEPSNV
jgi:uncharacterized protein